MREEFDHIVIGAGLGGLSAACLLVQRGKKVLLLEAHSSVGGCVSYFARKKFLFDAGATTLSGMGNEQPVQRLLRRLNMDLPVRLCDPGMTVHIGNNRISRWTNNAQWVTECERVFGSYRQKEFWSLVHSVAAKGWESSRKVTSVPIQSFSDLLALPSALPFVSLGQHLFRSVGDVLRELNLFSNKEFLRFIAEQLIITTQSSIDDTPFIVGAMGLNYPSDTWYVDGGMNMFPRMLQKYFVENGGTLLLKKKVRTVTSNGIFSVITDDGQVFRAKNVVSNATGWNNMDLFPEQHAYFAKEYSPLAGWGAFTLYAGVQDSFWDFDSLFHQIILDTPLSFTGSNSLFLSFSHREDRSRSPEGYRTLTVSTHVPHPHQWWKLSEKEIAERKSVLTNEILAAIGKYLPRFNASEKPVMMTGTPITFEHFTHRKFGQVGGIPQSMHRPIFSWQGWKTNHKGVTLVGDTIYPGQGAPGVILGALNLVDGIA